MPPRKEKGARQKGETDVLGFKKKSHRHYSQLKVEDRKGKLNGYPGGGKCALVSPRSRKGEGRKARLVEEELEKRKRAGVAAISG